MSDNPFFKSSLWQVAQVVLSGTLLVLVGGVYNNYNDGQKGQQDILIQVALLHQAQQAQQDDTRAIKQQLDSLTTSSNQFSKVWAILDEDGRRLDHLEGYKDKAARRSE